VTINQPARHGRQTATLIRLSHGHSLQLDDRLADAKPDKLSVAITAFEHLVGSPGCHYLSLQFMFTDQQIGGSPDVAIRDHLI
jgi:hypothetical protein